MVEEKKKTDVERQFFKSLLNLIKQDCLQVVRVFSNLPQNEQVQLLEQINYLLKKVEQHKKKFEMDIKNSQK